MSVVTLNIPVPKFGSGIPVDVSTIVGDKTVVLAGDLVGTYVLLAGHDVAGMVPLVVLNSDGSNTVINLEVGTFKYMAVRVIGNVAPSVSATLLVSGASSPGQNGYSTLAIVPPGARGPQPYVDTYSLFAPGSLVEDLTFVCRGTFSGPLQVEGSQDSSRWANIGTFTVGTVNSPATLVEAPPLYTPDKFRYLRVNVQARVDDTTLVTFGGRQASSNTSGATGATGASGVGAPGATGASGADGGVGATGASGVGAAGATGASGADGGVGATGASGVGAPGATGASGADGGVGATGASGVGAAGATGASGADGEVGATGASGVGVPGATGASGADGGVGATGASGVGAAGATGASGAAGGVGATGASGVGATGATGASGTNILFTAKGDLLSYDGATATVVPVGVTPGMVPMAATGAPVGWAWQALATGSLATPGILQLGSVAGTACAGNDPRLGNPAYSGRLVIPTRNSTTSSRSKDGGNTWIAGAGLTSGGWYGCVWDPVHGRFVTISNGAGLTGGCMYSVDGAATWTTGGILSLSITTWFKVFYDPGHGRLFAVPQSQTSGAVYSDDGGTTWNVSASTIVSTGWFDAAYDLGNSRWVITSSSSNDTMYTTDGGVTWHAGGSTGLPMASIAYDPLRARLVALPNNPNTTCQYSTDGGATWNNGALGLTAGSSYFGQVWDPVHQRLVMSDNGHTQTYYSVNGGTTWIANGILPAFCDMRQMTYDAVSGLIWMAHFATTTLYSSENGGLTWVASTAPNTCGPILGVATP